MSMSATSKRSAFQCDEIWSFVYAKQKNVPEEMKGQFGVGDVWTWVAIDAQSKLCISYLVGLRDGGYAHEFMNDVAGRLANRVQLTTDGHAAYLEAVEDAFGGAVGVDYAQLIKIYGNERAGEARYSPPVCVGTQREACLRHGGQSAHFDQLYRTPEPYHADAHATVYAVDERLFQKD